VNPPRARRIEYRLHQPGAGWSGGEISVSASDAIPLRLSVRRPGPGALEWALVLESNDIRPIRVRVHDVTGRLVADRRLVSPAGGAIVLPAGELGARHSGWLWVRAEQGGATAVCRVPVLR
jgi:hypothetical protein